MIYPKSFNLLLRLAVLRGLFGLMVSSADRKRSKSSYELAQHRKWYLWPFFLMPINSFVKTIEKMRKLVYPQQLQKWRTCLQLVSLYPSDTFISSAGMLKVSPHAQPTEEVYCPVPVARQSSQSWLPQPSHTLLCITPKDVQS